ncbi:MAG: LCP family protein [Raoultibacter sp.]
MMSRSSRRGRPNGDAGRSSQPVRNGASSRDSRSASNIPSRDQERRNSQRRPSGSFDPSAYGRDAYGTKGTKSRQRPTTQPRPQDGHRSTSAVAGQYSRNNSQYSRKKKGMSRGKKIGLGVLVVLLVAFVGVGGAMAWFVNDINSTLRGNKSAEEVRAIQDVTVPTKNFKDPFYMMLIGSDKRAGDEAGGQRSDTNIVVRVDPSRSIVTMISIPRDTKIDIDGEGTNKFNAAYNYGGAAATIREASQLLGVKISHYAEVNFEELVALVDAVGGVSVVVPELIDDPDAGDIVIQPGPQVLDGEAALVFARSRAYADGDFTRASNQRLLVEGLIGKVLSLPVTDIPNVIQKAAKCATTDFSVNDILSLAMQFKNAGAFTMYSAMVPSTIPPLDANGVSYVVADTTTLKSMMKVVEAGEDPATVVSTTGSVMSSALSQPVSPSAPVTTGTAAGGGR